MPRRRTTYRPSRPANRQLHEEFEAKRGLDQLYKSVHCPSAIVTLDRGLVGRRYADFNRSDEVTADRH